MGIFEELQNRNQGRWRSESCHDDWDQSPPVLWGASRSKTRLWHVRLLIDHCHGTVIKRTIGEWNQMETDILYVDDFTLLSSTAEEKLNQLDGTISGKKNRSKDQCREDQSFKVWPWKRDPLNIEESEVDDMDSFVYLGAKVDKQGGTASDIRARLGNARMEFKKLSKAQNRRLFNQKTKIVRIFGINERCYQTNQCCRRWTRWLADTTTKEDKSKIYVSQHKCLKGIQRVYQDGTHMGIRRRRPRETWRRII